MDNAPSHKPRLGDRRLAPIAALAVFLGGASYGLVGPIVKTATAQGAQWYQMSTAQSFGGLFIFSIAFGISLLAGARWQRVSPRDMAMLLLLGATTGVTSFCYNICLAHASASLAVTLLFQYVWMGIAIQAVASKKPPVAREVVAAAVVLAGTVGASGMLDGPFSLDLPGLLAGLGSALGYAVFLRLSARAGRGMPAMQRGLLTCVGSCIVGLAVCPTYFFGGADLALITPYSLALGFFALFLPVPLIGFGSRHVSGGTCNILASSELPSAFVASAVWLGEPMGPVRVIGAATILAGIALTQVRGRRGDAG